MKPILRFDSVGKRYANVTALDAVSFEISAGERVALLGPNGAGKTTAVEIALGLRRSTSGSVSVLGGSPRDTATRSRIGATPQETGFPDNLCVRDVLEFVRGNYPSPRPLDELLAGLALGDLRDVRMGTLSGGQQRRVAVACALAGNPDLVMLDEPTTGLDVESRRAMWTALDAAISAQRAVVFSTHYLEEAETFASRVIVIDSGRVRYDGGVSGLRERFGQRTISYRGAPFAFADAAIRVLDGRVIATATDTDAYVRAMVGAQHNFSHLNISDASLEDAFVAMTADGKTS